MNLTTAEIVFAASIAIAALTDTASAQTSQGSSVIDTSLRNAVERKDVPGVVALITDRERVLYQGAFGVADVATGRPLTADALFRIASMTKPITSVALMQLVEQGRLGLEDPAEKYLPELAGLKVIESFDPATGAYQVRPASRPPTVRHFLTHTSGLAYPFTSAIWRDFKPRAGETYPFGGPGNAGTTAPAPMSSANWSRWYLARSSKIISASTSLLRSRWMTRLIMCRSKRGRASSRNSSVPARAWTAPLNYKIRSLGSP